MVERRARAIFFFEPRTGRVTEAPDVGAPHWRPLVLAGGTYNPALRNAARGSGAYAIKTRAGKVLYVGHSHTGRTWKTMLRHLQGPDSFERVGDWVYRGDARDLLVSVWPSSPTDAPEIEGELIERLEPAGNLARPAQPDDDEGVPF